MEVGRVRVVSHLVAGALLCPVSVSPQAQDRAAADLAALLEASGVSGYETAVREAVASRLPGWAAPEVDNLGNLTVTVGSGRPDLLLLAHLDEPGYVVSRITGDGYLRVERLVRFPPVSPRTGRALPVSPLFDQFHEGQLVTIGTREGPVLGAVATLSIHLQRERVRPPLATEILTVEDLWIDVGAESVEEVRSRGINLLDPVHLFKEATPLAGRRLAGPEAGGRAGALVLVEVLRNLQRERLKRSVVFAWASQHWTGNRGAARLARRFEPKKVVVLGGLFPPQDLESVSLESIGRLGDGPVLGAIPLGEKGGADLLQRLEERARALSVPLQRHPASPFHQGTVFAEGVEAVPLGVPVRYPGTPVETVDLDDLDRVVRLLGDLLTAP